MADEYTVEATLEKLREMFGDTLCELRIRSQSIGLGRFIIDLPETVSFTPLYDDTLEGLMVQVKKWRESQS